jgi:hypothetical protein
MFKKFFCILLLFPIFLNASIQIEFNFSENDLEFHKIVDPLDISEVEYDKVSLGIRSAVVCGMTPPGTPSIGGIGRSVVIPPNATIKDIRVVSSERVEIPGEYNIYPVQKNVAFSNPDPKFTEPKEEVYNSTELFPGRLVRLNGSSSLSGYRIGGFMVYPLQYIPSKGTLFLYTNIVIEIDYEVEKVRVQKMTEEQIRIYSKSVERMVVNSEDIIRFTPPLKTSFKKSNTLSNLPAGEVEYVIVAPASDTAEYDDLLYWKKKKGIKNPKSIALDWIYSNYSGANNTGKISMFVADAETTWGAMYFLMAGDPSDNVVPIKQMRADYLSNPPVTDRYYGETDYYLDGTETDNDAGARELEDVMVARASVANNTEIQAFIKKTLRHEKDPVFEDMNPNYDNPVMYVPVYELWSDWTGDIPADTIAAQTPNPWQDSVLYHDNAPPLAELNATEQSGIRYFHQIGHGSETYWGGTDRYNNSVDQTKSDVSNFTNYPNTPIGTQISCLTGKLDYSTEDCFCEAYMNNPDGGVVAIQGNSREGLGSRSGAWDDENESRSSGLCTDFYRYQWKWGSDRIIQEAWLHSKNYVTSNYISGHSDDMSVWSRNDLITFGDPELPLYTTASEIYALSGSHNSTVPTGSSDFSVNITANSSPVENARVCCWCKSEASMWVRSYTNASGDVTLSVSPTIDNDTMWVTATKPNYKPYESFAIVSGGGNSPPNTPSTPSGPSSGYVDSTYTFSTSATDPDGDNVAYRFAWGDGDTSAYTSYVSSGNSASNDHSYLSAGTYNVKSQAKDVNGATSTWSSAHTIEISEVNSPPNTPSTPSGPSSGYVDSTYTFSTSATDPDGDNVAYRFAWGDGDTSAYTSYVSSGNSASKDQIYLSTGTYEIRAQAKDINGATSGWSSAHTIDISDVQVNSPPTIPTLIRIFDDAIFNASLTEFACTLSFVSTDPNNDDIEYEIYWGNDPLLAIPSSKTTSIYGSGVAAVTTISTVAETLYFWKARARDPAGSGNWSSWSETRCFTMDQEVGNSPEYWYQISGSQFNKCDKNNVTVQGNSVVLGATKTKGTRTTILLENWESGSMPSGWHAVDYNSDGNKWTVGTTSRLGSYEPPSYGSYYAYYNDYDAGGTSPATQERIYYEPIYLNTEIDSLKIYYEYGFYERILESMGFYAFFHYPTGDTWASSAAFGWHEASGSSSELINLSDTLYNGHNPGTGSIERPDSVEFAWIYHDNGLRGWAGSIDSVHAFTITNDVTGQEGILTGPAVVYNDLKTESSDRTHWDGVKWTKSSADDSIGVQVEFKDGGIWSLVSDSDLPDNSTGFFDNTNTFCTVDLSMLNTSTYDTLRIKTIFRTTGSKASSYPALKMWGLGSTEGNITGISEDENPLNFALEIIGPNPFINKTEIRYQLPKKSNVLLKIYDITGREIITFVNEIKEPGYYYIQWNGFDKNGNKLPSGVYFIQMVSGDYSDSQKVLIVR